MPVSRLRFRFAAWFAVAFLIALGGVEAVLYLSFRRVADQDLADALLSEAQAVSRFLQDEAAEDPTGDRETVLQAGLREILPFGGMAAVRDGNGRIVAFQGPEPLQRWLAEPGRVDRGEDIRSAPSGGEHDYRVVTVPLLGATGGSVSLIGRTDAMNEQMENLLRWMLATAPVIAILSAGGGYLLSRRAVDPMLALAEAIDRLPTADRSARLPVGAKPDEVDHLADRFNSLLTRLRDAERQNQRFVGEAAHQIRTPLTIVLGEAELALADDVDVAEGRAAMRRVQAAAAQMKHRVDELFLLAESESDSSVALTDEIDLEGLAFDVTDLMRGRAAKTGHPMELGQIEPVTVLGNQALLREALMELLENACRHSDPGSPVAVTVVANDGWVNLLVESRGLPLPSHVIEPENPQGMGLRIVAWIARQHGGRLVATSSGGTNTVGIRWPAAPKAQGRGA